MAKGGRLHSLTSKAFAVALALSVAACARQAPSLPPDYGDGAMDSTQAVKSLPAHIQALSCGDIDRRLALIEKNDRALEETIRANRATNQAAGYIASVIFPPALFAAEHDGVAKGELNQNQEKRDQLLLVQKNKRCFAAR